MRQICLSLMAATAVGAIASQSAFAADMPPLRRAPPPEMVMIPYDWTGVYIGGHGGLGLNRSTWGDPGLSDCLTILPGALSCARPSDLGSHIGLGFVGGGQAGFNIQSGPLVIGVEGSYSYADVAGDHSSSYTFSDGIIGIGGSGSVNEKLSSKVTGIAIVAGRLGIASLPSDRALFYVMGGAAYMRQEVTSAVNGNYGTIGLGTSTYNGQTSATLDRWGWMAGAGVEFGLFGNWSAKVEYNYLDFGSTDVALTGTQTTNGLCTPICVPITTASSNVRSIDTQIHMIKFGLNYRFMGGLSY
jgi:outer membrane immunogenic protein